MKRQLNGKNKIFAINVDTKPVISYKVGTVRWAKEGTEAVDMKIWKLLS